jgi:hypothetical protein
LMVCLEWAMVMGSTCAARRDGPFYDRSMSAR